MQRAWFRPYRGAQFWLIFAPAMGYDGPRQRGNQMDESHGTIAGDGSE